MSASEPERPAQNLLAKQTLYTTMTSGSKLLENINFDRKNIPYQVVKSVAKVQHFFTRNFDQASRGSPDRAVSKAARGLTR
jgi:hypothetical protein